MNDMTFHNIKDERAGLSQEQQVLLAALKAGFAQIDAGETVPADNQFFNQLRERVTKNGEAVSQVA